MTPLASRGRWRARNPPATGIDRHRARVVVEATASALMQRGAKAVVLAGSWARGDAHRESDIDLWVFGLPPGTEILWREPFMVTVAKTSEGSERRKLRSPPDVGGAVPGWRVAVPIRDPDRLAERLKTEAGAFRWTMISRRCDRWVAEQIVGWAEEAVKLVRALGAGNFTTAAVQRNLLADHLGFIMAIDRRVFWDSENEFWERIGRRVGGAWARAQRKALGTPSAGIEESCEAALALYALTAEAVWKRLDPQQRAIVSNTCRVAGRPLSREGSLRGPASPRARSSRTSCLGPAPRASGASA